LKRAKEGEKSVSNQKLDEKKANWSVKGSAISQIISRLERMRARR